MTIYLVRHAHAGARGAWSGDDVLRPLTSKGRRQSRHVAELLGDRPVGVIFASPARRCIETVEPLAKAHGLAIDEAMALFEGNAPNEALDLAMANRKDDPVLCSHGDVIPAIISRLRSAGLRTADDHLCEKGSIWALDLAKDGHVKHAEYLPPLR